MVRFNFFSKLNGSSILFLGLLLSVSAFLFSGCAKDDSNIDELLRLQEEAYRKQLGEDTLTIKKYLADNNITNAKSTKSGLFYTVQTPGVGVTPKQSEFAHVYYTLKNLKGETLDESVTKTAKFMLEPQRLIYGFLEGVLLMKVGGKSKLYIPSGLAYGAGGSQNIPPNTILIFEVELMQVSQN